MQPDAVVVRRARAEDGIALEALAAEAGLKFQAEQDLHRQDRVVLVAADAGRPLGFVSLQVLVDEGEILDLAVLTGYRRLGVGRRLVIAAMDEARARGVARLLLEVRRTNRAAIGLYESRGFSQVGERKRYYSDGEDALLLSALLESPR